jgi:hypothetical protein
MVQIQEEKGMLVRRVFFMLCSLLLILLGSGCPPGPDDLDVVYYRFTPMVTDEDMETDVVLEARVEGSPSAVRLSLQSGSDVDLRDDGSGGDAAAGDEIYTVTLSAAQVLHNFTADDVNRNFIGYLRLYSGEELGTQINIFADIITEAIPPVQVEVLTPNVQYSDHLVNIVAPGFFSSFDNADVTGTFYTHFGDNFDYINIIYEIPHIENRHHVTVKNDVQGIGVGIRDDTADYGSSGRLMGYTVFPIPTFFDGASPDYQHELGHQWVNFLSVPPLDVAVPHWPLSDLASGIMGWGKGRNTQGLTFNFYIVYVGGGNFQLEADYEPKVFTDLSLYLMGLIPPAEVAGHFVFDNQDQDPMAGGTLSGPVTSFVVGDIIASLGPRLPASHDAAKKFRVATVIVSKDGLLSERAMRLYDYFSVRAEETEVVSYSSGLVKGQAKPFYLSTREIGRLDTRIKYRILIDASRDGGIWWFPQVGAFDPAAPHQGKALADFLRSEDYKVEELPRPYTISPDLLAGWDLVVRVVGLGSYAPDEIGAYQDYVWEGGNLLLLADHGRPDALALSFGIRFEGASRGESVLSDYHPHPLTQELEDVFYNCGGGLTLYPETAQVIGSLSAGSYIDTNNNGSRDAGEPSAPPVLGVMPYGEGTVVFCGDANLWETVPQPLVNNLLHWLILQ